MKSSTSNGANLCQKKGGEHTPIILKPDRNTEIFILLVPLQTHGSWSSSYPAQTSGGREGTKKAKSILKLPSFCSLFPLSDH